MRRHKPWRQRAVVADVGRQSIETADARLLAVVDGAFASAAERAGSRLVCQPGCHECCVGPFPITPLDVMRLRKGVAELERLDPAGAAALRSRALSSRQQLRAGFPGNAQAGKLDADQATLDGYFAKHKALACPVVEPQSGKCMLYEWRPVACRNYGPPILFGGERAPHCKLCFQGAPPEEIERCRVEPDPQGLEQALLDRLDVSPGDEWSTLIAFAVVDAP